MTVQYNNNGDTGRYDCTAMKSNYGEPFCQSLTAAPLDALITRPVLQALEPAALEASVALATDLEAERAALDLHWQQRLEGACYEVERARRQYNACEPENRLVARSLERTWEEALAERRDWRPTTNAFGVKDWQYQARQNSTRSAILRRICPHSGGPKQPPRRNAKPSSDCCSNVSWSKWCTTRSRFVLCAIGTAAIEPCTS
jgi:hypothetical protein